MAPDPDDEILAQQLFEAARRERPQADVQRSALRAASAPKRSLWRQSWLLVALALGAAGVVALVARGFESGTSAWSGQETASSAIRAEPMRALSKPVASLSRSGEVVSLRKRTIESPVSLPVTAQSTNSTHAPARSAAPNIPPASLEAELELLDAARQALLGGDTEAARMRLLQYDKAATRRHLGAEATLLRVQILAADGRAAEASALASEFAANNPNSPLVDRANSFVQSSPRGSIKEGVGP